jgi:DNA repair protein RAD7
MAGRKKRERIQEVDANTVGQSRESDGAGPSTSGAGTNSGEAQSNAARNKRQMADVARLRAAHFATFDVGDNEGDELHTGGDAARGLGPWSTAYQLAAGRDDAKTRRHENIVSSGRKKKECDMEKFDYESWVPPKETGVPKQHDTVPLLRSVAVKTVTEVIECVETLWGIPDDLRSRLAAEVCRKRKMNSETFLLFMKDTSSEVVIPDCSQVEEPFFLKGSLEALHGGLRTLSLGLCGRGMSDDVAKRLAEEAVFGSLETLELRGAYRLTDAACELLIARARNLRHLVLSQCSRIDGTVIAKLPKLVPELKSLDLSWCCGIPRTMLSTAFQDLHQLESISLDGFVDVGDDMLIEGAMNNLKSLKSISMAQCKGISDKGLSALWTHHPNLERVILDECDVSSASLMVLAESCPNLAFLSLKRCEKVTDSAIMCMAEHCALQKLYLNGVSKLSGASLECLVHKCSKSLQELDISWCRDIPEKAVGYLCDSCPFLRKIIVWGCTQIQSRFLGHSNNNLQIIGRVEGITVT